MLIAAGGKFCSALDPFTADEAADSLQQIANLHAASHLLEGKDWIRPRAAELARMQYMTAEVLQGLLDDPRGVNLSPQVRSGARLLEGMKALADKSEGSPQFLVHGDAHAGNIFRTASGSGPDRLAGAATRLMGDRCRLSSLRGAAGGTGRSGGTPPAGDLPRHGARAWA